MSDKQTGDKLTGTVNQGRRRFLAGSAAVGAASVAGAAGMAGVGALTHSQPAKAQANSSTADIHVAPGELDEYYGFWSGGQSGGGGVYGVASIGENMGRWEGG